MFLRNSAVERGRQHNLRHCAATGQVVPLPRRKMSQCHKIETKTKKLCHKIENKKKTLCHEIETKQKTPCHKTKSKTKRLCQYMSQIRNQNEDTMSPNRKPK